MKTAEPKTLIRVLKAENKELRYKNQNIKREIKENANSIKELRAGNTENASNINYRIAKKLQEEVSRWISREFNAIQVDTLTAEGELYEYIESDYSPADYYKNDKTIENLRDFLTSNRYFENEEKAEEFITVNIEEEANLETVDSILFIKLENYSEQDFENYISELEDYQQHEDQHRQDNYPMWNTCFEFSEEPPEEWIQHAKDSGIGVISNFKEHNTILFFAGCGYSFYASHWIPLYLRCFKEDAKKYAGINFQGV
jgi:hypothetical protein